MKIAVTGAVGFIGRHVVQEALIQGFEVLAIVRESVPDGWGNKKHLKIFRCDLLDTKNLAVLISDCEIVIHLAAVMSGENCMQYSQTIAMTKKLLEAMDRANVERLIALSSISVLDYINQNEMVLIDEFTPLNREDRTLSSYALMKRDQEKLYQQWHKNTNKDLAILRAGLVYNNQYLSSSHVGFIKRRGGLSVNHCGKIPVVQVESVANAIVKRIGEVLHVIDIVHLVNDDLPSQFVYIEALKVRGMKLILIPIHWWFYSMLTGFVRFALIATGKRSKIPDSFKKNSVAARQKPFKFSNEKAKDLLGWNPVGSID